MTTVNCPKCDEQVRMPANASAEARVQCPLCVEEFELAEALDRLAPMLVVLNDPGAADAAFSPSKKTFSGTDLVTDSNGEGKTATQEFSFEDSSTEPDSAPAFAFEDGSVTSGSAGTVTTRRARSQRPQKSAIKEMVKIVGGGVIGLTIGQLILWWLPGDYKRDPIELGPKVPSFAAFLVHPKFRGNAVVEKNAATESQQDSSSPSLGSFNFDDVGNPELPTASFDGMPDPNKKQGEKKKKKRNKKNSKDETSDTGKVPAGDAAEPDDGKEPSSGDSSSDPLAPLATETEDDVLGTKPDIEVPMINLESFPTATDATPEESQPGDSGDSNPPISPPPTTTPPAPTPTPPPAATGDFEGVRNAPKISVDQLSSRLTGAVSASTAMDSSSTEPGPKQLSLAKEFYMTMAGLGEAITFVDQVSASVEVNEVGKFALGVGKQPAKLDLIGKVAPSWIKNSRPHNGLVVCGTVDSIDFAAPYYVTSLVMPNKSVLKVVSINDPSGDYQRQDKILVLGSILDSPQQDLKDYQGEATRVILDGLHATLPSAE
ncbi:MAG: hypothetical protein QF918_04590 [Pirellulaceae bacterium]|jgi:hypothetical protein|nr:hypothetical protein [Pirellulaceae bacterium]MDP6553792.1 hypothetical protein [Pirellulaceae bacterium]